MTMSICPPLTCWVHENLCYRDMEADLRVCKDAILYCGRESVQRSIGNRDT